MKNRCILLASLLLLTTCLSAQVINVSCIINNGCGKYFRLERTSDYVTNTQEVVFAAVIDHSNKVSFSFESTDTEEYTLYVDFAEATVYLTPDIMYDIYVTQPSNISLTQNPFTNPQYLSVDITSSEINDINSIIQAFNLSYDDFLLANLEKIMRGNYITHNEFKNKVLTGIKVYNNIFLNTYVDYSFAITEISMSSKKLLSDYYLLNSPVQFHNPAYMSFLKEYSKNVGFSPTISDTDNRALIELASIINIANYISTGNIDRNEIIKLINKAIQNTTEPEIELICNNMLSQVTLLMQGTTLPELELFDKDNNPVNINTLSHKDKYLFFFKCSLRQNLDELDSFLKAAPPTIDVVPIALDLDYPNHQVVLQKYANVYHPINVIEVHRLLNIREYPFVVKVGSDFKLK